MTREDRWLQPDEALSDSPRCPTCDAPLELDDDWPQNLVACPCETEAEAA